VRGKRRRDRFVREESSGLGADDTPASDGRRRLSDAGT
jgi:hypothetical protein